MAFFIQIFFLFGTPPSLPLRSPLVSKLLVLFLFPQEAPFYFYSVVSLSQFTAPPLPRPLILPLSPPLSIFLT